MERESELNDSYEDNYDDDNQQYDVITSLVFHTLSHHLWQTLIINQAYNCFGFLMLEEDTSLDTLCIEYIIFLNKSKVLKVGSR